LRFYLLIRFARPSTGGGGIAAMAKQLALNPAAMLAPGAQRPIKEDARTYHTPDLHLDPNDVIQ
jgi:hypothetical protein